MAYEQSFYEAIKVGIEATGQRGVDDLERSMQALKSQLAAYQQQMAASGTMTTKQIGDLANLKGSVDKATEAFAAGQRVLAGQPAYVKSAADAMKSYGNVVREAGRGLQDYVLSNGNLIGVANNVSTATASVASAMGASATKIALTAGATDLLVSAGTALWMHWPKVKAMFDDGLGPRALPSLKEYKAELESLTSKQQIVSIDVIGIRNLEIAASQAERAAAALKAMDGPTSKEKATGDAVADLVKESGGRPNLTQAVFDQMQKDRGVNGSGELQAIQKELDAARRAKANYIPNGYNYNEAYQLDNQVAALEQRLKDQGGTDTKNLRDAAQKVVSDAGAGNADAQKQLADLLDGKANLLTANRIAPDFVAKLREAMKTPGKKEQKEQDDTRREVERDIEQAGAEAGREIRETIASVKAGIFEKLADEIQRAIAGGSTPDAARAAARPGLVAYIKGRNALFSTVQPAADEILDSAGDEAESRHDTGQKSRLATKLDQAKAKAAHEHEQAVAEQVRRVQAQYESSIMRAYERHMAQGQDPLTYAPNISRQIQGLLPSRNVPAELQKEVADRISKAIAEKAVNREGADAKAAGKPYMDEAEAFIK